MKEYQTGPDWFERRYRGETLRVEAWSQDCIRVRATRANQFKPYDWAITEKQGNLQTGVIFENDLPVLRNGRVSVTACPDHPYCDEQPLRFFNSDTGDTLLEEKSSKWVLPDAGRTIQSVGDASYEVQAQFEANDNESFYGLGQNQQGLFNRKGSTLELKHQNTQTVIPVVYSSRGYGFFWNNPGAGRVELVNNGTLWSADRTDQIDYFVFFGDGPGGTLENYARLTGFAPMMPEWATGFWQSKLRYKTQSELLEVAEEYSRRGLPLSVMVIDYFHWRRMGDWDFDSEKWPDPTAMTERLRSMGVETVVSVWPMVNPDCENFQAMEDHGYLVGAENGLPVFKCFTDTYDGTKHLSIADFTNPDAAQFVWQKVKANYYDHGVKSFWLDAVEPEVHPVDTGNLRYHLGNGATCSSLFPLLEEKTFFEGAISAGEAKPLNLCRSGWAGSQRYGACIWSGDVPSTFQALREQIVNGLSMAMSGIPWWTTDVGGFFGGDSEDPEFRELLIRWFQWAVFTPVLRLHGMRGSTGSAKAGDANELWSFGEEIYTVLRNLVLLRERLRPYLSEAMTAAHERGLPPLRPLLVDFPGDPKTCSIGDEQLFGSSLLVAPVAYYGQRERSVYLPAGATWQDAYSGSDYEGGQSVTAEAPLEHIPVFLRDGARLPIREGS